MHSMSNVIFYSLSSLNHTSFNKSKEVADLPPDLVHIQNTGTQFVYDLMALANPGAHT